MNLRTIMCLNIGRMYGRVGAPIHAWPLPGPRQAGCSVTKSHVSQGASAGGAATTASFVLCMCVKIN